MILRTIPGATPASWVADRFGITLSTTATPVGLEVADLVQVALRRNPRRAHLLVSTVLGKHLPVDPRRIIGAGRLLGALVDRLLTGAASVPPGWIPAARETVLDGDPSALADVLPAPPTVARPLLVIGFAETATALGQLVADQLGAAWYLHSTRRAGSTVPVTARFEESHSHATTHLLQPSLPEILGTAGPLVLVDDEISTGRTALAVITELHARAPREEYVIASLVDLRSAADRAEIDGMAARLGVRIDVVSLVTGTVELPAGLAAAVASGLPPPPPPSSVIPSALPRAIVIDWPAALVDAARHGTGWADHERRDGAVARSTELLRSRIRSVSRAYPDRPHRVLVVGTEEFMDLPLRIAARLVDPTLGSPALEVRFQSTTRSPVHPVDDPGYPIRRRFAFAATDLDDPAEPRERYLYNACWPGGPSDEADVLLLLVDTQHDLDSVCAATGPAGQLAAAGIPVLVAQLASVAGKGSQLPEPLRGPAFGSYRPDQVGWLLTDLSHLDLEGDVRQREVLIQSGAAHYAESLPVEFLPDPSYRRLFDEVLAESARRLATAVGVVTELVLAERGPHVTLASLARAGTPIGILMRRWAAHRHGLDLPHYAVSIVRGRGIDRVALRYLAQHHDPESVVFVDGWTGKGAIARELTAALAEVRAQERLDFDDDLAVLADPGHCVRTFGTRDDFLIASACLNSTVSGLVSRTVLNAAYLTPDQFHGAKAYRGLAGDDVSQVLLDSVSAHFDAVVRDVQTGLSAVRDGDRTPTFAGWAAIEAIREEYGISSVNFVKPGVGETTRVLLRRVPWRILLRENDNPDHRHLRLLAAERSVPIEIRPDLPYSCVGLIRQLSADDRGEG